MNDQRGYSKLWVDSTIGGVVYLSRTSLRILFALGFAICGSNIQELVCQEETHVRCHFA